MSRILVVDDEPADLHLVSRALEKLGHEIATAESAKDSLKILKKAQPHVAVLDIMLPDGNGLELLKKIREIDERLPVIFMTSTSDSGTAIRAMKLGALDHLVKPIDVAELRKVVERALEIRQLTEKPVEVNADVGAVDTQSIIGKCHAMQEVYKSIGIVAGQDVTVLIRGESGTGKELVARALYQYSERVTGPFLAVNCAAIPEALLESELFGHEKGAFTGADRKRIGKFEQSSGGTLFLDEIGDMSPVLQAKLLRVLQEKQFERVGGNDVITSDVRVIAATNRNLEKMVADGEFRADLYYRLNGFTIHLPPLKERGNDLVMLVNHFRRIVNRELNKNVREVSPKAMELLREYSWPGNIRELQNVIRQSILRTSGPVLLPDFLPTLTVDDQLHKSPEVQTNRPARQVEATDTSNSNRRPRPQEMNSSLDNLIRERLEINSPTLYDDIIGHVENRLVSLALKKAADDETEATRVLGIDGSELRNKSAMEQLGLDAAHANTNEVNENQVIFRASMTMAEIEKEVIRSTLARTDGCRKEAAKLLGMSTRTMQRRVKEYELD